MRTTTGTKNKIKKFEGLRLKAYVCAAGVCTIGYGHTTSVKPGDVITEAQADAFFESDIRAVENQVNALPLHLGQYQFDAVVSFCFNVGIAFNQFVITAPGDNRYYLPVLDFPDHRNKHQEKPVTADIVIFIERFLILD